MNEKQSKLLDKLKDPQFNDIKWLHRKLMHNWVWTSSKTGFTELSVLIFLKITKIINDNDVFGTVDAHGKVENNKRVSEVVREHIYIFDTLELERMPEDRIQIILTLIRNFDKLQHLFVTNDESNLVDNFTKWKKMLFMFDDTSKVMLHLKSVEYFDCFYLLLFVFVRIGNHFLTCQFEEKDYLSYVVKLQKVAIYYNYFVNYLYQYHNKFFKIYNI